MAEAIFKLTWVIWAITAVIGCISQYGPWSGNSAATVAAANHRPSAAVAARGLAGATKLRANASYTAPAATAPLTSSLQ